MFVAFLLGGILPIILYSLLGTGYISLVIAIGTSRCFLFTVGALKARIARKSWKKGGIEMAGLGTGIALARYGIGAELTRTGIVNIALTNGY
jgi:VIT1/CCC1 family predicted Fe2+/Mn2+ transporter